MIEWLWANLDEVLGLVLGLTTAGAFWYAYRGRNTLGAIIGLTGNAGWWVFAVTVRAWMLLFAVAIMTAIHGFNLWKSLRRRRPTAEAALREVVASGRVAAPAKMTRHMLGLHNETRSGTPCRLCAHLSGGHGRYGCTVILRDGAPCTCTLTRDTEETQ